MSTIVIGIGSPYGHDCAGWDALDRLSATASVKKAIAANTLRLKKLDRPGMALLDELQGFDRAVLLDAVISNDYAAGTWLPLTLAQLQSFQRSLSSHGIGVAETLEIGKTLSLLPPMVEIWGIVVAEDALHSAA